jgi:hypothetical protein
MNVIGCATHDADNPKDKPLIVYGEPQEKVLKKIGSAGQLLFRFTAEGRDYEIRANNAYQGDVESRYLLIFEGNHLVSVVTADQGLKLWGKFFGNFAISPPDPEKFQAIVSEVVSSRASLDTIDFRRSQQPKPKEKSAGLEAAKKTGQGAAEMAGMGVAYSIIMPWYAPVLYAGAAVTAVAAPVMGASEEIRDRAKSASAHRYYSFVEKTENIAFLSRAENVFAKLGKPTITFNVPDKPNETIYIFRDMLFPVSLGFVTDELRWIGYDYDPVAKIKQRKDFEDVMGPYHPQARALWLNEYRVNSKSYPSYRARNSFTPPILDQKSPVTAAVETVDRWQVTHVIDGVYLIQSESFQKRQCEKMRGIIYKATDVTPPSCSSTKHGFLINSAGEMAGGWVQVALLDEKREGLIKFNPIRHQRESWPQNPVFLKTESNHSFR